MSDLISYALSEIVFWMAWIIIPITMEIAPAFLAFIIMLKRELFKKKETMPIKLPEITLIIPVYNSYDTLEICLQSIYNSDYPKELISIILVNNEGQDNSFDIFAQCQVKYPQLSMQWLNAYQGKSKALNMALFNSHGKYIIHIDSDGRLHPQALKNMIMRFEENEDYNCVTGTIFTDPLQIQKYKGFLNKLFRDVEFYEYAQAFLAGRTVEAEFNNMYTLSGAFSAFRKSTILKTQMYNTETVCEDTHITFQVRELLKKKIDICENAIFFVDPIESFDRLYTQRQRWQRGELEVAHMFLLKKLNAAKGFASNFAIRLIMYDHTFAFPRMIWYFALICLTFMNYSMSLIAYSVFLIYVLYVISAFLFYLGINISLKQFKDLKDYYFKRSYIILIMPIFNFIVFWIRFAGIINSIKGESAWKTQTVTQEIKTIKEIIKSDFNKLIKIKNKIEGFINNE